MITWKETCKSCGRTKTMRTFDKKPHMLITVDGEVFYTHASSPAWALQNYIEQNELNPQEIQKAYKANLVHIYCEINGEIHQAPSTQ